MIKSVESPHYHVWTDALYARFLAQAATNDWDRGSLVRWCVGSAWTAFELSAEDALGTHDLGNRFKERFDDAVSDRNLPPVDWGQGIWQATMRIYGLRKKYIHAVATQADLFPDLAIANDAIVTLRAAVKAVYSVVGKPQPDWVEDDTVPADPKGATATLTLFRGIRPDDRNPHRIRVTFVYRGVEHEDTVFAPGSDPLPRMEEVLRTTTVPITCVRAYEGDDVLHEWQVKMRGS